MKNIKANTCFHVIPYIRSPVMGVYPHISVATMTTFPGTSLIIKKINWVDSRIGALEPPLSSAIIHGHLRY